MDAPPVTFEYISARDLTSWALPFMNTFLIHWCFFLASELVLWYAYVVVLHIFGEGEYEDDRKTTFKSDYGRVKSI